MLNNVGIVIGGGVVELSEENWDKIFAVNLKSAYLSMKHAIPIMVAAGGGSIVNISSISGIRYLGRNYVGYYTTKAALNHMTRVTAAEYAGRQVRVNAVSAGLMDTPMAKISAQKNHGASPEQMDELWKQRAARIPMGWMGDAFDVARAAVFLRLRRVPVHHRPDVGCRRRHDALHRRERAYVSSPRASASAKVLGRPTDLIST